MHTLAHQHTHQCYARAHPRTPPHLHRTTVAFLPCLDRSVVCCRCTASASASLPFLPHALSRALSLSLSLTHTHTHARSLSLSLSLVRLGTRAGSGSNEAVGRLRYHTRGTRPPLTPHPLTPHPLTPHAALLLHLLLYFSFCIFVFFLLSEQMHRLAHLTPHAALVPPKSPCVAAHGS